MYSLPKVSHESAGASCIACLPFSRSGAAENKVFFECTCEDVVGAGWATSFRDLIASSPRFTEAQAPEFEVAKDAYGKSLERRGP